MYSFFFLFYFRTGILFSVYMCVHESVFVARWIYECTGLCFAQGAKWVLEAELNLSCHSSRTINLADWFSQWDTGLPG